MQIVPLTVFFPTRSTLYQNRDRETEAEKEDSGRASIRLRQSWLERALLNLFTLPAGLHSVKATFNSMGRFQRSFFTPKWLPLINRDLVSPSGQLYPSPCPCPPAFVWLSSSPHGGCEHSGSPCSPSTSPGAVDRTHISFFFMEHTVSLTELPLLLESWCSGINSGQRASSNTSAAVGNMSCTAGGQSFQLKKEFSPSRNL